MADSDKTEKATPKRKQEERKKGHVIMSQEINTVFTLLVIFFALRYLTPGICLRLQSATVDFFTMGATVDSISLTDVMSFYLRNAVLYCFTALPLLLITAVSITVVTMGQTRMLYANKAMEWKWDRLNPFQGLKKLFSLRGFVELVKATVKIVILGYIIYLEMEKAIAMLPRLMDMDILAVAAFTGELILSIVWRAGAVFVVLAVADYFYQWWDYERQLRMSKKEIKDEYKETEGDPMIRSRLRSKREQMARQRMMANVPMSDVVIRNPTHFAVALKYDPDTNRAPVVTAKGMDSLALRIIQVARENEVYIMENKPLARSLFEEVELDQEIPETFYQAIAEVLAFVYSIRERDGKDPLTGRQEMKSEDDTFDAAGVQ
ncbi:MAG: flagellar biosynthesis protein FlhB [Peptococcaceae bacterium]|jgi:flagellar biosynthetic protein FlhB|nr:flagellar biosynthesis protein FlhB [Peptococcaceae bacterium]